MPAEQLRPSDATRRLGDGSEARGWLVCRSGIHLFALPLDHVIETMRVLPIKAVAGVPRYVRGLSIIRGMPVPVVDTGCILSDRAITPERIVTVTTGTRMVALAVEAVVGIYAARPEELCQLPPLLRDADTIAAIGALDAELLLCLSFARLIPEDVLERLDAEEAAS